MGDRQGFRRQETPAVLGCRGFDLLRGHAQNRSPALLHGAQELLKVDVVFHSVGHLNLEDVLFCHAAEAAHLGAAFLVLPRRLALLILADALALEAAGRRRGARATVLLTPGAASTSGGLGAVPLLDTSASVRASVLAGPRRRVVEAAVVELAGLLRAARAERTRLGRRGRGAPQTQGRDRQGHPDPRPDAQGPGPRRPPRPQPRRGPGPAPRRGGRGGWGKGW